MDFKKFETAIKDYIKTNYKSGTLPVIDNWIDDSIDSDKYKQSNQVFFDFSKYEFSGLSNCSEEQTGTITIYFMCRNDTSEKLKSRMLDYTSIFFDFIHENSTFGGIADSASIKTVSFFYDIEGDTGIKISATEIEVKTETT
jgi:hypothetical protein